MTIIDIKNQNYMAKRGRKKKGEGQSSETPTTYFSDIQENAVVSFLESSDEN